jgi:hypothetical protein
LYCLVDTNRNLKKQLPSEHTWGKKVECMSYIDVNILLKEECGE